MVSEPEEQLLVTNPERWCKLSRTHRRGKTQMRANLNKASRSNETIHVKKPVPLSAEACHRLIEFLKIHAGESLK